MNDFVSQRCVYISHVAVIWVKCYQLWRGGGKAGSNASVGKHCIMYRNRNPKDGPLPNTDIVICLRLRRYQLSNSQTDIAEDEE